MVDMRRNLISAGNMGQARASSQKDSLSPQPNADNAQALEDGADQNPLQGKFDPSKFISEDFL